MTTNDKKIIINKIVNQANSLNKKIKKFKDEGIKDHYDFIEVMFNDKQMKYNDSGSLTKSKKFYGDQNILELKRTLSILTKINNHDVFGTINKYKKTANDRWTTLQDTVKEILIAKGYPEDKVNMIVSSNNFVKSLEMAFKGIKKGYGSKQTVENVYLQYAQFGMDEEELKKATSNVEHSISRMDELEKRLQEEREFEEWQRGKR